MKDILYKPLIIEWKLSGGHNELGYEHKRKIFEEIKKIHPAKIIIINPFSRDDLKVIDEFLTSKPTDQKLYLQVNHFCHIPKSIIAGFDHIQYIIHDEFVNLLTNDMKHIRYVQESKDISCCIMLDAQNYKYLDKLIDHLSEEISYQDIKIKLSHSQAVEKRITSDLLHDMIVSIMDCMNKYDFNFAVYSDEKIASDILNDPYFRLGNLYISEDGCISLFPYLPAYDFDITNEGRSLAEAWRAYYYQYGARDIYKIIDSPRYWQKWG